MIELYVDNIDISSVSFKELAKPDNISKRLLELFSSDLNNSIVILLFG
jgi:hypothetical protein